MDDTHIPNKCIDVYMVRMCVCEEGRDLSKDGTGLHLIDVRKPKAFHVTALKLYEP